MTGAPDEALRAVVRGRVQGVGFRAFVATIARAHNITGFARNQADGQTVEVVAEGPRETLQVLLAEIRKGPALSRVDSVEETWSAATGAFSDFSTR